MTLPYCYNCTDKSILLPFYKKFYVTPWFRIVPAWLTANFITILSTGFVVGMMVSALLIEGPGSPVQALISALCLHTYLLGDHLDGMQAKESHTSSPLGEFLDHYLDVYNGAIVFFTLVLFLGPVSSRVFLILLVLNCTAFAATMVEELECRMLVFGYLGTLEGVVLLVLFYISWLVPAIRDIWQLELIAGFPAYWIVIAGLGVGYLATVLDILIRMKRLPLPFALFCGLCGVLAWTLSHHPVSQLWSWLVLTLFSGEYIARVMQSYLLSQPHFYPDLLSSMLILFALIAEIAGWFSPGWWRPFLILLTVWLIIRVTYAFGMAVFNMREHWFWVNPQ